ncbi:MAG: type II secretion system F family protein [Thermodesulfobacteriota bacterium]
MPEYEYRAVDSQGCVSIGIMEAHSEDTLESKLANVDYILIDAKEKGNKRSSFNLFAGKVKSKELLSFTVYLYTAVSSGVPLLTAISGFTEEQDDSRLKTVLQGVAINIQGGDTFAGALKRYPDVFPNIYVSLIEAGETSGKLEDTIASLIAYIEDQEKFRAAMKQATTYPIIIISMVVALLIFIISFVIPKFMPIFESAGVDLPGPALFLMALSRTFDEGWLYMVGGLAVVAMLFYTLTRSELAATAIDRMKLRIPLFGEILMKISMSQFSYILSTLLGAGVEICRSFALSENAIKNRAVSKAINNVILRVRSGESITDSMKECSLFPPLVLQMLSAGEQTGSLPATLKRINTYYDREIDDSIKRAFAILQPAITIFCGVVVGGIAVTIFLTLYKVIIAVGQS